MTAASVGEGQPEPTPYVRPETWFVLFCRECDPELAFPNPFTSAEERGRWASAHKKGTGHDRWFVIDQPAESSDV